MIDKGFADVCNAPAGWEGLSEHRLAENLAAANVTLTPEEAARINEATSQMAIDSARYPEALEARTGR